MPGEFTDFQPQRGSPGWELDWDGYEVFIKVVAAAKIGIDACLELCVADAKAFHPDFPPVSAPFTPFATHVDTEPAEQTINAIDILSHAVVEPKGWFLPENPPHVWGAWGVRSEPRFHDDTGELQGETTKDIAMFLEFGTVKMEPRPFLYPSWDVNKRLLPALVRLAYEALLGGASAA